MPFTIPRHKIFHKTTFHHSSTSLQRHSAMLPFACIYTIQVLHHGLDISENSFRIIQSQFESKNQTFTFTDKCSGSAKHLDIHSVVLLNQDPQPHILLLPVGAELCRILTVFSFRALLIQEKFRLLSSSHSKSVIQLPLLKYITFLCILTLKALQIFVWFSKMKILFKA